MNTIPIDKATYEQAIQEAPSDKEKLAIFTDYEHLSPDFWKPSNEKEAPPSPQAVSLTELRNDKEANKPTPFVFSQISYENIESGWKQGTIGMINAGGGVGKSLLTLALLLDIAIESNAPTTHNIERGNPGVHYQPAPSLLFPKGIHTSLGKRDRLLFVTMEDDKQSIIQRFNNLFQDKKHILERYEKEKAFDKVDIITANELQDPRTNLFSYLKQWSKDYALIALDPISQLYNPETESKNEVASEWIRRLNEAKQPSTSILLIHHSTKESVSKGTTTGSSRGSSAIMDGVRFALGLLDYGKANASGKNLQERTQSEYAFKEKLNAWLKSQQAPAKANKLLLLENTKNNNSNPLANQWYIALTNGGLTTLDKPKEFWEHMNQKGKPEAKQSNGIEKKVKLES